MRPCQCPVCSPCSVSRGSTVKAALARWQWGGVFQVVLWATPLPLARPTAKGVDPTEARNFQRGLEARRPQETEA